MTGKKKTILVVEDDQSLLDAIIHQFIVRGFNVLGVRNTDDAMKALNKGVFDALWLDHYLLGKQNGLDFVSDIKKDKSLENIPIFVVSNSSENDNIKAYMRLGVRQYYTKVDYDLNQIISDIETSLKNNQ